MNGLVRRGLTVIGATAGVIALSSGTAFAHYCYRTDVPENSKMVKGGAWVTKAEMAQALPHFGLPPECATRLVAHVGSLPENTLFMGPGLLAGGAIPKRLGPEGVGHLFQDAMAFDECAVLFEE